MAEIIERTIAKVGKGPGGWFVVTRFDDATTEVKAGPFDNRAAARDEYRKLGGKVTPPADAAVQKKGVDAA